MYEVYTINQGIKRLIMKTGDWDEAAKKYKRHSEHGGARLSIDGRQLPICEADKLTGVDGRAFMHGRKRRAE
jgi:hypothetical protein